MSIYWLRNEITTGFVNLAQRYKESIDDEEILELQQTASKLWATAQDNIDHYNRSVLTKLCEEFAKLFEEWEPKAFEYAYEHGNSTPQLEYARGIDRVHERLRILAEELGINEGQKPPLP